MQRSKIALSTLYFAFLLLCACSRTEVGEVQPQNGEAASTVTPAGGITSSSPVSASSKKSPVQFDEEFVDEYADDSEEFIDEYADEEGGEEELLDPLSGWNHVWFHFNDKLHDWVLKPVSKGYGYVVPSPLRRGFRNALHNLGMPSRLVSTSLQGHGKCAATELTRFVVNTTIGVAGLWDPATRWFHLQDHDEDFDQTLGVWGMGQGIYLTWPILGPSSVRATLAAPVDMALDPISLVPGGSMFKVINNMSLEEENVYEALVKMSLDPYTTIRSAYIQNRQHLVETTH